MFRIVRKENGEDHYLIDFNQWLKFHHNTRKSWRKWKKRNAAEKVLKFIQETYDVNDAWIEEFETNEHSTPKKKADNEEEVDNTNEDCNENTKDTHWWSDYNTMCKRCTKMCKQSSKVTFEIRCPQFTSESEVVEEGEE